MPTVHCTVVHNLPQPMYLQVLGKYKLIYFFTSIILFSNNKIYKQNQTPHSGR